MHTFVNFAFLCTGSAPRGAELEQIRLNHALGVVAGVIVAFNLFLFANHKIKHKKWRIAVNIVLGLLTLGGFALAAFLYSISTCGIN